MTIQRKTPRYAHSDGHTDVCYTEDGMKLITCGTDGDIRIWSDFDDVDPTQACIGEWSVCVCQKGDYLYVATDKNIVQRMTFPDAERDGILVRFTAPVNHMAARKNYDLIAVASEDMEVKIIDLTDTHNVKCFTELKGPPLSIALCPKAKLLAVSCGDGTLRVWNVNNQELLKEIDCVPKTNSFMNAKLLSRIDFDPILGETIAYPTNNSVVIINTSDWSNKMVLICPEIEAPYSIVQFSPCGNFLAATSQKGQLVVWEVHSQNVVDVTKHAKAINISGMVWNPKGNGEIAFCDVEGQFGLATDCTNINRVARSISISETYDVDFSEYQIEDDDDDNENVISLEKLKNDILGINTNDNDRGTSPASTPRPRTPEIPMQKAFVPTSTPEHLNPRYLCWNDVGIMRCYGSYEDESDNKSIEVEFHDASLHNSMTVPNFQSYTMGTLSKTSLIVANSRTITIIPLSSGSKEWNINVPEDEEEIICIANSDYLVCFGTSNYLIKIYSTYGIQKSVISVPGPIISMAVYNYFLLTAYHYSTARKGDQCINLMLTNFQGISIKNKNLNSALRPETTLQWMGFTDLGTPAMQDSGGLLSLSPLSANVWLPFCDTTKHRKNPSDGFFITCVYESLQGVRGIHCRTSLYPGFIPRPTLAELTLEPPFNDLVSEKSQLEAKLYTWSQLQVENVEKQMKEIGLKSFALACKNNLNQRALELITMLENPQLLALATKYASKLNRRWLTEKLMELASREFALNDNNEINSTSTVEEVSISKRVLSIKRTNKAKVIQRNSVSEEPEQNCNDNATPSSSNANDTMESDISLLHCSNTTINETEVRNPFLKSLKKANLREYNPLSLTDKFAGFEEAKSNEKEHTVGTNTTIKEKRKKPDSETDNPNNKIKKLQKFSYSKRS